MTLTNVTCQNAKFDPSEKPNGKKHRLAAGSGLFLHIKPEGKYWRLHYRFDGKQKLLALGVYPQVTLLEAREARDKAKKLIRDNIDPAAHKEEQKRARRVKNANTFEVMGREWHEKKKGGLSGDYAQTIMTRLEADLFPRIGKLPIADITPAILLDALQDIEKRGVFETTKRAKQYCGQIFRYAILKGFPVRDITIDLKYALETRKTEHFASIEPSELPKFLKDLYRNDSRMYPTTRLAVELLMHTFVRTTELIEARWFEIDWDGKVWSIPATRMKMDKPHLVPLSRQTLEILRNIQRYTGNYEFIFASSNKPKQPISNNTILKSLDRMGYKGKMTGHGFRSLAMTTILERLGYEFDVVDAQLAHAKKHSLGAAYDRAKYITQRTQMMQDWSDYLEKIA